ncbi:heparinase II/III domain-containing protein [Krasilnikoviella flava]|uniref:Heparinase II/III-like protein n=1 Tax=Krasilnikoviella flava TaxID=526729 RepID=A0A1T5K1F2_9MICO|nr:heparinase II/III family protein [Krasilnikoviella flava]SKC57309.1 Heparinase II/III-like protein [Krasilnikoviella flava]
MTSLAPVPLPAGAVAAGLPRQRGGWWHDFVCPTHGTELSHAGIPGPVPPVGGVRCPHGCTVDTELVRGAWLVLSHQAWARRARVLAHRAARTGDAAARAEAVALLVGYADVYAEVAGGGEHERAQDWMLRGRLFHQALTDAIWAVSIGHAVWSLAEADPDRAGDLVPVLGMLDATAEAARAARGRLVDDGRFTSNYTAWLNAAGRVCSRAAALVRGDRQAPAVAGDEWLSGEHGQLAHALAASTRGGWEWEASTYYHGFVVRAYLLSLRGTDPTDLPADARDRLVAMVDVLAGLATDGGVLPSVHDGPYSRPALALEWTELAALADGFVADAGLAAVAAHARTEAAAGDGDDEGADGLEDELRRMAPGWFAAPPLAVARPPRPAVSLDEEVGIAVLRGAGIHAVLDHGPHGAGHGHHDKLALALFGRSTPWQPDPGQVPYGHPAWRSHYASAAAHPVVRVDDADPAEATGRLLARDERSLTVEVRGDATSWYDGARAVRHVVLGDGYLLDVVHARADRPRRLVLGLRPDVPLGVRVDGDVVRTAWLGAEALDGVHAAGAAGPDGAGTDGPVPVRAVVLPGPGPADDPQRERAHVDWAAEGATSATWVSVYQADVDARGGGADVTGVELDAAEVRVLRADGAVHVHALPEAMA